MEELKSVEFNELVYTASKSLKVPALGVSHNLDDANEVIQEAILKSLKNETKFKTGTNIKTWFYAVLKKPFNSSDLNLDKVSDDFAESQTLTSDERSNTSVAIQVTIDTLEERLKKPFTLYYEGFKTSEIAIKLDTSIESIESSIKEARSLLMQSI